MSAQDEIEFEILPNGTIKVKTGSISQMNHSRADGLVKMLGELVGGSVTAEHRHGEKHHHEHVVQKQEVKVR